MAADFFRLLKLGVWGLPLPHVFWRPHEALVLFWEPTGFPEILESPRVWGPSSPLCRGHWPVTMPSLVRSSWPSCQGAAEKPVGSAGLEKKLI